MNKKTKLLVPIGFALLLFVGIIISLGVLCGPLALGIIGSIDKPSHDEVITDTFEAYSFDPSTILDLSSSQSFDNFTLAGQGEDAFWENFELQATSPSVQWEQADYIEVASTFLQETLQEDINTWNTTELTFRLDCEDAPLGPQHFLMILTRTTLGVSSENSIRQELHINVFPKTERLLFWERTYTANYGSKPYLNLDEINISVEDALRLAENNGGEEVRENLSNSCSIEIGVSEGVVNNDWVIRYTKEGNTRLEMFVDEQTGKIHKLLITE